MTRQELSEITTERKYIDSRLDVLDPDNLIENQEMERLLQKLDFLEYKLNFALKENRRERLKVVSY